MRRPIMLVAPVLLLLAAACGQAADSVADDAVGTVEDGAGIRDVTVTDVEACGLLTTDEIVARGRTITGGPEPAPAATRHSTCYFYVGESDRPDCGCTASPGYIEGQITLTIWSGDDGFQTVKAAADGGAGDLDAAEAVEGLGVEAYYRAGRGAVDVLLEDRRHFALESAEVALFGTPEFRDDLLTWARLAVARL